MNPNTMTAQECADWCAMDDGWTNTIEQLAGIHRAYRVRWYRNIASTVPNVNTREWHESHPHPLTLDGAAKALPEGWVWCKCLDVAENEDGWYGWNERTQRRSDGVFICDPITNGPDELTARYRLAVACRLAMEKTT